MSQAWFEPTISAGEQLRTYASERAATGTGCEKEQVHVIFFSGDINNGWMCGIPSYKKLLI